MTKGCKCTQEHTGGLEDLEGQLLYLYAHADEPEDLDDQASYLCQPADEPEDTDDQVLYFCARAGGRDADRAGGHDGGSLLLQPGPAGRSGCAEAGGHCTGAAPQAELRELQQPAGEFAAPGQDQVSQSTQWWLFLHVQGFGENVRQFTPRLRFF